MKYKYSALIAVFLLAIPCVIIGVDRADGFRPAGISGFYDGSLLTAIQEHLDKNVPYRQTIKELELGIRAFGGLREYSQIFITGDELIPNIDPPMDYWVAENTAAILRFAENAGIPTYLMLIPTASAVRQQSLPRFTSDQVFNQRQFIEDVYSEMAGSVTVADAYPVLFNARDQYIYYRTENNLTSLGGYHLYSALSGKLLEGMAGRSLSDYDIEYALNDYYGDLYRHSPLKGTRGDTISLFRYTRNPRQYLVTHRQGSESKTYHTLYPTHLLDTDRKTDVFLGGISAVTHIRSSSPYRASLLVFGDRTAISYVPFLANHYRNITVVDLFQLETSGYASINLHNYAQVLFAYSIESYMHSNNPARAQRFLQYLDERPVEYW